MFQTKAVQPIKHTFLSNNLFFENRAVYEIMWENMVERGRTKMAIRRMRITCWVSKAADTHSEYELSTDFPRHSGYANAPQYYVI